MSDYYRKKIAENFKNGIIAGSILMGIAYLVLTIKDNWQAILDFFK